MQPDANGRIPSQSDDATVARFLVELENQIGPKNFQYWFANKVRLTKTGDELIVGVGSSFLLNWMQKHFRTETAVAARIAWGEDITVRFTVENIKPAISETADAKTDEPFDESTEDPAATLPQPSVSRRTQRRFADLQDFVGDGVNDVPLMAASQVSENPGERYNPLFYYGHTGCGKTHLLEGIYRAVRRQHPTLKAVYLTAEDFTNYFTTALRKHTLPGFREKFRTVDLLLVDDVGFFEGKTATQEEFQHTIDHLTRHGRQVVLACDRHPRLLSRLTDGLTTRFASGLVCRVDMPDFEARLAILTRKAAQSSSRISPEALRFTASRAYKNVRELEGAFNCLVTQYELRRKSVGISNARQALAEHDRASRRPVRPADIERAVCEFFGVQARDLKSPKRTRAISQPRMIAMFLMRRHLQAAYAEIGKHFGGRNHATVIAAEKRVQEWLDNGTTLKIAAETWPFAEVIAVIEQRLAG